MKHSVSVWGRGVACPAQTGCVGEYEGPQAECATSQHNLPDLQEYTAAIPPTKCRTVAVMGVWNNAYVVANEMDAVDAQHKDWPGTGASG